MSEQINDIRKRHEIETRYETFECRDINNAVNHLEWRLGDKHLNPLVNSDRAYLLNRIAELKATIRRVENLDQYVFVDGDIRPASYHPFQRKFVAVDAIETALAGDKETGQ